MSVTSSSSKATVGDSVWTLGNLTVSRGLWSINLTAIAHFMKDLIQTRRRLIVAEDNPRSRR